MKTIFTISITFLFFLIIQPVSANQYNQACLNGGTIPDFKCNGNKLEQDRAHTFCTNKHRNSPKNIYMDCMGSFLPFKGHSSEPRGCNVLDTNFIELHWGECRAEISDIQFQNLEKITVENVAEGYSGTAEFQCQNGWFKETGATAVCMKNAKKCPLDGETFTWPVSHLGDFAVENINVNNTDWGKLGLTSEYNQLLNTDCVARNFTGELETFDQRLIVPNQGNIRASNDNSYSFSPKIIADTDGYFGDLQSRKVEYCYEGEINNNISRERFNIVSENLLNNNLITQQRFNDLTAKKCTIRPADCEAAEMSFSENNASCDFDIPRMKHGSNPIEMTVFKQLGTESKPIDFGTSHGEGTFGCFNNNTILDRAQCHLNPVCKENPVFNTGERSIISPEYTIDNPNNSLSDRELIEIVSSDNEDYFQERCDDYSLEGVGGKILSITTSSFDRDIVNENAVMRLNAQCAYIDTPEDLCTIGDQEITNAFVENSNVFVKWTCENGLMKNECQDPVDYEFPDEREDPVFEYEWVIAGAVTEGSRNLDRGNGFSRFNGPYPSRELPDVMTKEVVIALDRVRLGKNNGGHSSRGGNATGRAREAFNESGCSVFERKNFEEFSYTRSRTGTNRHYGVVIAQCPCSASSDREACESGTQPNIFAPPSSGGDGGGDGGGGDPEMPVIIVE